MSSWQLIISLQATVSELREVKVGKGFNSLNNKNETFSCLRKKNVILIVFFSPEFKYDIGFSPSRKVSERQTFIISNTLIFSTFLTTKYSNIRTHLESKKWRFSAIFRLWSIPLDGPTIPLELAHLVPSHLQCSRSFYFTMDKWTIKHLLKNNLKLK